MEKKKEQNIKKSAEDMESIRLKYNAKILGLIWDIAIEYPDLRFCQIMSILGYDFSQDRFNEESYSTYAKMLSEQTLLTKNKL